MIKSTISLMFSGGLDSTGVFWKLIQKIKKIFMFLSLILLLPLFLIYFFLCFIIPIIKIGKIKKGKGIKIYIYKDFIHSDFIIESDLIKDIFTTNKKYTKIGWGNRRMFLEIKTWNELSIKDFLFAFFGLNQTVLRIQHLENLPVCKSIEIDQNQLDILKDHIKKSYYGKIIDKKENYYENGDYYESKYKYNCINTCNNWINTGLRKAKISNRIWCPLSYWV